MWRFRFECGWRKPLCASLLLLTSGLASRARAQQVVPLAVDDLLRVRTFPPYVPLQFSPDGKWLSYTIKAGYQKDNSQPASDLLTGVPSHVIGADIFIVEVESGKTET